MSAESQAPQPIYDLGHQGDYDWTQLEQTLSMTPTERLRKMEAWKDSLNRMTPAHAKLIREIHRKPVLGKG